MGNIVIGICIGMVLGALIAAKEPSPPRYNCAKADRESMTEWIKWCTDRKNLGPLTCASTAKPLFCEAACGGEHEQ